jgi:nucleoside-diphosphate-sugar epimerase
MHIAILGATSQIARDFALSCARQGQHELHLFARRPQAVAGWLVAAGHPGRYVAADYAAFAQDTHYDALINFVGAGNPATVTAMGSSIFDVTAHYDDLALAYLQRQPQCRYLFLSSGAVYGGNFAAPVSSATPASVPLNDLQTRDWYGLAKLCAELKHRRQANLPIIDVRLFGYFSRSQEATATYFLSDIVRSLQQGSELSVGAANILRDYLHPDDFHQLVFRLLDNPPANLALDIYSCAPVAKFDLLAALAARFGLDYRIDTAGGAPSGNEKMNYYSLDRRAGTFGYQPTRSSLQTVLDELDALIPGRST